MNVVDFGMNVQDAVNCAALPSPVDAGRDHAWSRGYLARHRSRCWKSAAIQ